MAIYHFHVTQISRGKGQTAVSAAAYRAGEKLHDNYYGEDPDYTKKSGVIYTEIILPNHVPREYADREMLWNAVEFAEANKKAQLAYSFDFALPNELSDEENCELARKFILENFTAKGMICDVAIHKPGKGPNNIPNPHVHVLVPMRPINQDGTWGSKQRREYLLDEHGERIKGRDGKYLFNAINTTDWGEVQTLEIWRANWAKEINRVLEEKGFAERVDYRSNIERNIEELPTIHEGPAVRAMEKKGIRTDKGEWNRYIKSINQSIRRLLGSIKEIIELITELKEEERELAVASSIFSNAVSEYLDACNRKYNNAKTKIRITSEVLNFIDKFEIRSLDDFETVVKNQYHKVTTIRTEMKEIERERRSIDELLRKYEQYRETLPVYQEWHSISNSKKKAAYKEEHGGELKIYHMAERMLREQYPDKKIPVKELHKKKNELTRRVEHLSSELEQAKKEASLSYRLKCEIADAYKKAYLENRKRKEEIKR